MLDWSDWKKFKIFDPKQSVDVKDLPENSDVNDPTCFNPFGRAFRLFILKLRKLVHITLEFFETFLVPQSRCISNNILK